MRQALTTSCLPAHTSLLEGFLEASAKHITEAPLPQLWVQGSPTEPAQPAQIPVPTEHAAWFDAGVLVSKEGERDSETGNAGPAGRACIVRWSGHAVLLMAAWWFSLSLAGCMQEGACTLSTVTGCSAHTPCRRR